jgi:hypothetical protein
MGRRTVLHYRYVAANYVSALHTLIITVEFAVRLAVRSIAGACTAAAAAESLIGCGLRTSTSTAACIRLPFSAECTRRTLRERCARVYVGLGDPARRVYRHCVPSCGVVYLRRRSGAPVSIHVVDVGINAQVSIYCNPREFGVCVGCRAIETAR